MTTLQTGGVVYITKDALKRGIIRTIVTSVSGDTVTVEGSRYGVYRIDRDAFTDRDEALRDGYQRRDDRISFLEQEVERVHRQIARLRTLEIVVRGEENA